MKSSTKIILLAGGLALVGAAYAGGWHFAAREIEARAADLLNGLSGRGLEARCEDLAVEGFPLRIGVSCARVTAASSAGGLRLVAGPLRSAAEIYRPGRIVSELEGPATVMLASGEPAELDWESLSTIGDLDLDGLSDGGVEARRVTASLALAGAQEDLAAAADRLGLKAMRNGTDLGISAEVDRLQLSGAGLPPKLPVVDLAASLDLKDRAGLLSGRSPSAHPLADLEGTLDNARVSLGAGADLQVSGPFSIDGDGRVSGEFSLRLDRFSVWKATLTDALPGAEETIAGIASMLSTMAREDSVSFIVTADAGRLSLGFIPLGRLPPLPL